MRFAIIGPGALGCLFASGLAKSRTNEKVLLVDHNITRADFLNKQGLIYEKDDQRELIPVSVTTDPGGLKSTDVVLLCVKSHQVLASLKRYGNFLQPGSLLVFLQNGIDHLDLAASKNLPFQSAYACTSEGATLLAPGHVRHAGAGTSHFGFLNQANKNSKDSLNATINILEERGFQTFLSRDILSRIWAKLFVNVGINGLTAIHNIRNGQLLESDTILQQIETAISEAKSVACAYGVNIKRDPYQQTLDVCKNTASNVSSMLQDVRMKRKTEIEAINGAIAKAGRKLAIPTPMNDFILKNVKKIEARYEKKEDRRNKR